MHGTFSISMDFAQILLKWYALNKRDLPWRESRDPYKIWLSEVILQQTRVDQGLPYYKAFVAKFPTINKLASAKETVILKTWQGLGYYSRARNLHAAAKMVVRDFNSEFPKTFDEIITLKGVGEYTASAISSICYKEAKAVVDGNVYRVLSRVFGIDTPIDSTQGKKKFRELANELLFTKDPGNYNQALMEFGAKQCVPKNPDCGNCPLVQFCVARKINLVNLLPVKEKKTKVTERHFTYLVMEQNKKIVLRNRTANDIWKGLHDFPLIETKKKLSEKKMIDSKEWKTIFYTSVTIKNISPEVKHILSHQRLFIKFVHVIVSGRIKLEKEWFFVLKKDLKKYAVPVVIAQFLQKGKLKGTRDSGSEK